MSNEKLKEEIRELLKSKGFKQSSHSGAILNKEAKVTQNDGRIVVLTTKYKIGKNNLQKFFSGYKKYSIPFSQLKIENGKITRK